MRVKIEEWFDIVCFILGGNATVTFKSTKTGTHFTYKIRRAKDGNVHFVSVLSGPDNTSDFRYIGCIFPEGSKGGVFRHTKKSTVSPDANSFKAFAWSWHNILHGNGSVPDTIEVYHEGRCGKCGRKLTTPESIKCGLGPVCRG